MKSHDSFITKYSTILSNLNLSTLKRFFKHTFNVFYIGAKRFYFDRGFEKASNLSFVTILSVVPVAILVFAFLSSYEYTSKTLQDNVKQVIILLFGVGLEGNLSPYLQSFSENVSNISYIGIIFLLFIAVDIIVILEKSINHIWHIKKGRPFIQNFFIYWSVLTATPFFLISSFYLTSKYQLGMGKAFSFESFTLIITTLGFFLIYAFLPRKKVYIIPAFIGALVAGLLFEFGKFIFSLYISYLAQETIKQIYGATFYIIPIFITWIYLSYVILLYGVEINYILQHKETYKNKLYKKTEDHKLALFYITATIYKVLNKFEDGGGKTSLAELADYNNISQVYMEDIADKLIDISIIAEANKKDTKYYLPLKPKEQIDIKELIKLIDTSYKSKASINVKEKQVIKLFEEIRSRLQDGIELKLGGVNFKDIEKASLDTGVK